jgi:mRNA interferase RelE/StbE
MKKRFAVKFTKKSYKEYAALDGAIINEVDEALGTLELRADEVGKPLGKKRQIDLRGTKERKLRSSGIRIIYQITDKRVDILEIVEVLLIDFKKDKTDIYLEAETRYREGVQRGGINDLNLDLFWNCVGSNDNEIDLNEPSMIDQIFDETFDDLYEDLKQKILDEYAHGHIESAYQIWIKSRGRE